MRKYAIVTAMAVILVMFAASASMAAPEMSISVNSGYSFTWGELEFEYKTDPMAFGAQLGYGWSLLELGAFGRYYLPLNQYFNIPPEYRLSFFGSVTPSLLLDVSPPVNAGFGLKVGPGLDFRWTQLRVYLELGYRFGWMGMTYHGFYSKGGVGYIF